MAYSSKTFYYFSGVLFVGAAIFSSVQSQATVFNINDYKILTKSREDVEKTYRPDQIKKVIDDLIQTVDRSNPDFVNQVHQLPIKAHQYAEQKASALEAAAEQNFSDIPELKRKYIETADVIRKNSGTVSTGLSYPVDRFSKSLIEILQDLYVYEYVDSVRRPVGVNMDKWRINSRMAYEGNVELINQALNSKTFWMHNLIFGLENPAKYIYNIFSEDHNLGNLYTSWLTIPLDLNLEQSGCDFDRRNPRLADGDQTLFRHNSSFENDFFINAVVLETEELPDSLDAIQDAKLVSNLIRKTNGVLSMKCNETAREIGNTDSRITVGPATSSVLSINYRKVTKFCLFYSLPVWNTVNVGPKYSEVVKSIRATFEN